METTWLEMRLIVLGKTKFERCKFLPIENDDFLKPRGGLWASPVNASYGWRDWVIDEEFRTDVYLATSFEVTYAGNTIVIDSEDDLSKLLWSSTLPPPFTRTVPDWEAMAVAGVDAIYLTARGEQETRYGYEYNLYGWDCETVLVMNPDCLTLDDETIQEQIHVTALD